MIWSNRSFLAWYVGFFTALGLVPLAVMVVVLAVTALVPLLCSTALGVFSEGLLLSVLLEEDS